MVHIRVPEGAGMRLDEITDGGELLMVGLDSLLNQFIVGDLDEIFRALAAERSIPKGFPHPRNWKEVKVLLSSIESDQWKVWQVGARDRGGESITVRYSGAWTRARGDVHYVVNLVQADEYLAIVRLDGKIYDWYVTNSMNGIPPGEPVSKDDGYTTESRYVIRDLPRGKRLDLP